MNIEEISRKLGLKPKIMLLLMKKITNQIHIFLPKFDLAQWT